MFITLGELIVPKVNINFGKNTSNSSEANEYNLKM